MWKSAQRTNHCNYSPNGNFFTVASICPSCQMVEEMRSRFARLCTQLSFWQAPKAYNSTACQSASRASVSCFCAATRSTKESRSCNTSIGLFGSSYGGTISPRRSSSALQAGGASSRRIPRKSGTLGCVENHVVHPGCSSAVVAASAHRLKNLEQRAHRPIARSKSL